ncbi:MAG: ABC transporter ATP-binding protein [Clostridium sp.]|jgi:sn-glycerol 3-phosphate transport system ATP-binding protein|nr:ABC transporter ATP-binding protein [Clostridium sp.]
MAIIELRGITKAYGKHPPVTENLRLSVADGSFTVLLGPSGCGKTTLLRIIAGLETENTGEVFIAGKNMAGVSPGDRGLAMVFQNYALYPAMTVKENMEFGLKNRKIPKAEREARIAESARMVGLEDLMGRRPGQLSGGQRQRVALARAMVQKPSVYLMDEPLSNLDAKLRSQIRSDLMELHRKLGAAFLYVTHDQTEAMSMATEIVLLDKGRIIQQDSPKKIYGEPCGLFAAQFIGSPPMNVIGADLLAARGVPVPAGAAYAGFRPEKAVLSCGNEAPGDAAAFPCALVSCELLGDQTLVKVRMGGDFFVKVAGSVELPYGAAMLSVDRRDLYFFDGSGKIIKSVSLPMWRNSI